MRYKKINRTVEVTITKTGNGQYLDQLSICYGASCQGSETAIIEAEQFQNSFKKQYVTIRIICDNDSDPLVIQSWLAAHITLKGKLRITAKDKVRPIDPRNSIAGKIDKYLFHNGPKPLELNQ